jgi:hypothetical protein
MGASILSLQGPQLERPSNKIYLGQNLSAVYVCEILYALMLIVFFFFFSFAGSTQMDMISCIYAVFIFTGDNLFGLCLIHRELFMCVNRA